MVTTATKIYALCHPHTGEVRYIGKTVSTLEQRLSTHLSFARTGKGKQPYLMNWIRSLPASPVMKMLLVVSGDGSQAEQGMIAFYRTKARLTNFTNGGEGTAGRRVSIETRQKISAANTGRKCSAEQLEKMRSAATGHKHTPETRAKISAILKNRSPEIYAQVSANRKGTKMSPEACAKISAGKIGHVVTEETRQKIRKAKVGKSLSLEHRQKLSIAGRGKKRGSPSDEVRARMSASHRGQIPHNKGKSPSLETRARMRASRLRFMEQNKAIQV